jgi:hypothetical protein
MTSKIYLIWGSTWWELFPIYSYCIYSFINSWRYPLEINISISFFECMTLFCVVSMIEVGGGDEGEDGSPLEPEGRWGWPHVLVRVANCQRTTSTQKLKLLGKVPRYDLYYSLTHPLKWKPFGLETCTCSPYIVLNFYQINGDGEIWTHDCLVIKALIPGQRTTSTQKLKLLGKVPRYDLYYSLTPTTTQGHSLYPSIQSYQT